MLILACRVPGWAPLGRRGNQFEIRETVVGQDVWTRHPSLYGKTELSSFVVIFIFLPRKNHRRVMARPVFMVTAHATDSRAPKAVFFRAGGGGHVGVPSTCPRLRHQPSFTPTSLRWCHSSLARDLIREPGQAPNSPTAVRTTLLT